MKHSEHRIRFSADCSALVVLASDVADFRLVYHEVARTAYQQREYVRTGKSWTMSSDHRLALAVDWVYYKLTKTGPVPIWSPVYNYEIRWAMWNWVDLDPTYNYCGWYEWDKDSPHMGRFRTAGLNDKSRLAAGLEFERQDERP